MHPYQLVKDHRTGYNHNQVNKVMDGDFSDFIMAYLKAQIHGTLGQNVDGDTDV